MDWVKETLTIEDVVSDSSLEIAQCSTNISFDPLGNPAGKVTKNNFMSFAQHSPRLEEHRGKECDERDYIIAYLNVFDDYFFDYFEKGDKCALWSILEEREMRETDR